MHNHRVSRTQIPAKPLHSCDKQSKFSCSIAIESLNNLRICVFLATTENASLGNSDFQATYLNCLLHSKIRGFINRPITSMQSLLQAKGWVAIRHQPNCIGIDPDIPTECSNDIIEKRPRVLPGDQNCKPRNYR